MFYCGTCGFSYDDWAGIYYPPKLPKKNWLSYYSQEFNALELNSTYYALPRMNVMESLAVKTGEGFRFSVKVNQEMTHQRQQGADIFKAFIHVIRPLVESRKMGCILAQFPNGFKYNEPNRDYLARFREYLADLPLIMEFRNAGWLNDDTLNWMKANQIGFCCVDEPQLEGLLPPVAVATSDIGYIRFHGRNAGKWWHHEHAWQRYDYTYSKAELEEWLPGISRINQSVKDTYIFANNHWRGQAVDTIRQIRSMLDQLVL